MSASFMPVQESDKNISTCLSTSGLSESAKTYQRIILTGFRATGKSVVGRRLAGLLGYGFVDTDTQLVAAMHCSVSEFVSRSGWPAFRQRERQLLQRLAHEKDIVIATGGGAVLHGDEWDGLRCDSLVIWLQADAETIRHRLQNDSESGVSRPPLTDAGPEDEVDGLLAERESLYRQGSDISLDTTELLPEAIASLILEKIVHNNKVTQNRKLSKG